MLLFLLDPKFWLSLTIVTFVYACLKLWILKFRMAPGPFPVPILGNMLVFRAAKCSSQELMKQLSKTYGEVMTLFIAHKPLVVLSKYNVVKDMLLQGVYSSRPESVLFDVITNGGQDVAFAPYNPLFVFHKKVALKSLRSIADTTRLEWQVNWAADFCIEQMLKQKDSLRPNAYMRNLVYNIIASFSFGKTYAFDDEQFQLLIRLNESATRDFGAALVFDFLPFGKYLPLNAFSLMRKFMNIVDTQQKYIRGLIQEHRDNFQEDNFRDFCDVILAEQRLVKENDNPDNQISDEHLTQMVLDLFNAGTETTNSTLIWLLLFLTVNPELQDECASLIKKTIGDRSPCLSDRSKLTLIDACIMETLRLRPPVTLGLPHAPLEDTCLANSHIPKGTTIVANLYAIQTDPEYWSKPLEFDPKEHFLDENGLLLKPPSFLPFGTGRRSCLGEQLAKNDLFLIVTRLLQKVRFEPVPGCQYDLEEDLAVDVLMVPKPYNIRIAERKS